MNEFAYQCIHCGQRFGSAEVIYQCHSCSKDNSPDLPPKAALRLEYDYSGYSAWLKKQQNHESGFMHSWQQWLWPLKSTASLPPLRIGQSPLILSERLRHTASSCALWVKDDGMNPSFSFKDRASALVSAFALERGISCIVAASTGNAGSSLAAICASQGQQAILMVPAAAPRAKVLQILLYGANILRVRGNYDAAFELSLRASREFGWYNRNTGYNPLTIEGKKSVSFEIWAQLGFKAPGRVFVSCGDGVIVSGVYKGFEELLMLGLIERMPRIFLIQSSGSDNLVRNLFTGTFHSTPSHTLADSISVDVPRNFYMARQFVHKYDGEGICVSDQEILQASSMLASKAGVFTEPAGAAAYAGYLASANRQNRKTTGDDVVLLTGSGLKDLESVQHIHAMPEAIEPDRRAMDYLARLNVNKNTRR